MKRQFSTLGLPPSKRSKDTYTGAEVNGHMMQRSPELLATEMVETTGHELRHSQSCTTLLATEMAKTTENELSVEIKLLRDTKHKLEKELAELKELHKRTIDNWFDASRRAREKIQDMKKWRGGGSPIVTDSDEDSVL